MPRIQYFLGANTPSGFYSLYDQLIDPTAARRIYLIKGGPGCGKSSTMGRVARRLEEAGHEVEYVLCSGDPDSLDAIHVPALRVSMADATAPHVLEPAYPGVVESYVNLSDCYDHSGLLPLREEIVAATAGYQGGYRRATRCLKAAGQLMEEQRALVETAGLAAKVGKRVKGIAGREFKKTGTSGTVTRRFLSGNTCRGEIILTDTVAAQCKRVYELVDDWGTAHLMLSPLLNAALAAGHRAVACPDPMDPVRLVHLLFPDLSLAFVSATSAKPWPGRPYRRVHLDAMGDQAVLKENRGRLRFGRKVRDLLMAEAIEALAQAKAVHDNLEQLYNPHVDFQRVYATADRLADEILAMPPEPVH